MDLCYKVGHTKVLNVQLKQWMHCLQGEFFFGNLVLLILKDLAELLSSTLALNES
jgi:hypothetical protein